MRLIDWMFIVFVIVGVPMSWYGCKGMMRTPFECQYKAKHLFSALFGFLYFVTPVLMVLIFLYTGWIQYAD